MKPKLSFYCCTYRRPELLADAIACFLNQDYNGQKELVIINDEPEQKLVFEHPDVRIINLEKRIPFIGGKHNIAVSECTGDILIPTDDDDVFLDHRGSMIVSGMRGGCWKTDRFYIDTVPMRATYGRIHGNYAFTPKVFIRSGGYEIKPRRGSFEMHLLGMIDFHMAQNALKCPQEDPPFYIYRKFLTGKAHLSSFRGNAFLSVPDLMPDFQEGVIELKPDTEKDWNKVVKKIETSNLQYVGDIDDTFTGGDLSTFNKGIVR